MAMMRRQLTEPPIPLRVHRQDLPEWCEPLVDRALQKSPAARFRTADEFRDALDRASGVSARRDLARELSGAPAERRRDPGEAAALDVQAFAAVAANPPATAGGALAPSVPASGEETVRASGGASATPRPTRTTIALSRTDTWWRGLRKGGLGASVAVLLLLIVIRWAVQLTPLAGAKAFPAAEFPVKTIVGGGGKVRERDARLVLDGGKVILAGRAAERPLREVSYRDVKSITHSRGRDPVWNSPQGPAVVVRAPGGAWDIFGMGARRDWICVETSSDEGITGRLLVVQLTDQTVTPVLAALEERTGIAAKSVRP
jgi:hypothetical protein